jgi:predicted permease
LGTLAKASSVGANTVKGPGLLNVSTSPAAFTASTRVLKFPAATAVSTIFFCDSVPVAFDAESDAPAKEANRNSAASIVMIFICMVSLTGFILLLSTGITNKPIHWVMPNFLYPSDNMYKGAYLK